jgi:Txe/YoeB family toxin of Txe-Axe toxin-antitoxin module
LGADPPKPFKIEIRDQKEFWAEVERLPAASQNDLTQFMRDYLQVAPTTYLPGKCKPLRGEYKGYWEYELAQSKRLIYWPDLSARVVYIDYLGPHPDWRKMRGGKL